MHSLYFSVIWIFNLIQGSPKDVAALSYKNRLLITIVLTVDMVIDGGLGLTWLVLVFCRLYVCCQGVSYRQWVMKRLERQMVARDRRIHQAAARKSVRGSHCKATLPISLKLSKNIANISELSRSEFSVERPASVNGLNIDPLKSCIDSIKVLKPLEIPKKSGKPSDLMRETNLASKVDFYQKIHQQMELGYKPSFTMQPRKSQKTNIDQGDLTTKRNELMKTASMI